MLALDQEPLSCGFILSGLRRSIDNLELARFLTEFVKSQAWDRDGFNTPGDWIKLEGKIVTVAPTITFGLARGPD